MNKALRLFAFLTVILCTSNLLLAGESYMRKIRLIDPEGKELTKVSCTVVLRAKNKTGSSQKHDDWPLVVGNTVAGEELADISVTLDTVGTNFQYFCHYRSDAAQFFAATNDLMLTALRARKINGTIIDDKGKVVPGVGVSCMGNTADYREQYSGGTSADNSGKFSLSGVCWTGKLEVFSYGSQVASNGARTVHYFSSHVDVDCSKELNEIVLAGKCRERYTVPVRAVRKDPVTGTLATLEIDADFSLALRDSDEGASPQISLRKGRGRFQQYPPGNYPLLGAQLSGTRYKLTDAVLHVPQDVTSDGELLIPVEEYPQTVFAVVVLGQNGKPLSGATVQYKDEFGSMKTIAADVAGKCKVSVGAPFITVTVSAPEHELLRHDLIRTKSINEIRLKPGKLQALEGRIADADGRPVTNVLVSARSDEGWIGQCVSDSAGKYSIPGVYGKSVTAIASLAGWPSVSATAGISASESLCNITMTKGFRIELKVDAELQKELRKEDKRGDLAFAGMDSDVVIGFSDALNTVDESKEMQELMKSRAAAWLEIGPARYLKPGKYTVVAVLDEDTVYELQEVDVSRDETIPLAAKTLTGCKRYPADAFRAKLKKMIGP